MALSRKRARLTRALFAGILAAALLGAGKEGPEARAHWPLESAQPAVQDLVDRGVAMLYAFDIGEARVLFREASRRAPSLAFPYLGLALAETIDINRRPTPDGDRRAAAAVAQARARAASASEGERALLGALGQRYGRGPLQPRLTRYASALRAYVAKRGDDPNLLVLTAFAIYQATGEPSAAATREIVEDCDRALKLDPANVGAFHVRIHALEESERSREAVPDAEALDRFVYPPGESHLPHMAGHVWGRLGDYDKMIAANERALENDRAWFALGDGPGQRYMRGYHDHDLEFLIYGFTTLGLDERARDAVRGEDAAMKIRLAMRLHEQSLAAPETAKLFGDDPAGRALLAGLRARRAGDAAAAVAAYRRAYEATRRDYPGDPKDYWWAPIGEGYGAALLAARRPAEAETVFTGELRRFPNDPRLAWGLAEAQKAQGKSDDAARTAYRAFWKGARELTLADLG